MYRIFMIEDDYAMAQTMKKQLEVWGHEVRLAGDFQNVIPEFAEYDPHLVMVDIMLPFFNGYHWCSEIRKISNVPVIFISSASDNMNIVMAMNMGGDEAAGGAAQDLRAGRTCAGAGAQGRGLKSE